MLTESEFHDCFRIIPNNKDGNCLFESIAYLIGGSPIATEIREMVGNFYREFDRDISYPESTIEYSIKLGILFDNADGDDVSAHDYNIWNDKVWASMTDVLICSLIFETNINLYTYSQETNAFCLEKITSQYNFENTVNLLYNGVDHFEAVDNNYFRGQSSPSDKDETSTTSSLSI